MSAAVGWLSTLDREAAEVTQSLRWGPLTAVLVVASAWWVKGLLLPAIGAVGDIAARRAPIALGSAAIAFGLASLLGAGMKELVGRARPPLDGSDLTAAIALPSSASFPSGHALTAFAAAAAIGHCSPRLRPVALALAAVVAVSRPYLGVHYWSDVIAGALLGAGIGLAVAWLVCRWTARRAAGAGRGRPPAAEAQPPRS